MSRLGAESRLATLAAIGVISAALSESVCANGDVFFRSIEIPGEPEFVVFGNVKDDKGNYLDNAVVTVTVPEHMLEFSAGTDVIGRYRTPDVGLAISDLGYEVDPYLIMVSVECPDHVELRREYRGRYRQNKGAVEVNFVMKRNEEASVESCFVSSILVNCWVQKLALWSAEQVESLQR